MRKLNILILHWLQNPARRLKAVEELEFKMPLYAPQHNYIFHDFDYPVTQELKDVDFDAILFGPTFLCLRNSKKLDQALAEKYDFFAGSNAVKIAFPQDEYTRSGILDNLLVDWNIDILFTLLPENVEQLLPKYAALNKPVLQGFTGYISADWIDYWKDSTPYHGRKIDVSYRAAKKPVCIDTLGYIKGTFGDRFLEAAADTNLTIDISTDLKDRIYGEAWHQFLLDSKFCLVTNSGSGIQDPYGEYEHLVRSYMESHPSATFQDIQRDCIIAPELVHDYTMLSPRNLEASLANTIQIATPGPYSGVFKQNEHFIALEPDCSNIDDVLAQMEDRDFAMTLALNSKETVLSSDALRIESHVDNVLVIIEEQLEKKHHRSTISENNFIRIKNDYWQQLQGLGFNKSITFSQLYA